MAEDDTDLIKQHLHSMGWSDGYDLEKPLGLPYRGGQLHAALVRDERVEFRHYNGGTKYRLKRVDHGA